MTYAIHSKPIQKIIENVQPSYWIYISATREFRLLAITYTYENGNHRKKLAWKTQFLNEALKMHRYLQEKHSRYDADSFQEAMENHFYKTGEKLNGLFTREWENRESED